MPRASLDETGELPNRWGVASAAGAPFSAKSSRVDADKDLHVLVDGYAPYKHPAIDLWLTRRLT
jgi:hypothetical protein